MGRKTKEMMEIKNIGKLYIPQSYLNRLVDKEEEQSPIDKLVEGKKWNY